MLQTEWACHQEAQDFQKQVLQELCCFHHNHAVAMKEVKAGRTALDHLEQQLVLESLEETHQLWASIDVAVAHERRVTKQLMASMPTPATPATVPRFCQPHHSHLVSLAILHPRHQEQDPSGSRLAG